MSRQSQGGRFDWSFSRVIGEQKQQGYFRMKDIQTWLGHSNYSFTANTYVHSSKDCHVQMAQAFSEKLPQLCSPTIEIIPSEPIIEGDFEVQKGVC